MKTFISYSFDDAAKFDDLCYTLDNHNILYWKTDEIAAGHVLGDKLREAVAKCAVCVFLATKNSIESKWCLAEVGAFWGAGKPVIVYLQDKLEESDLPKQLQRDKWTARVSDVVKALKVHLDEAAQKERERRSPLVAYESQSMALYGVKLAALRAATSDVWYIGATMHHTLENTLTVITDKIVAGVEINILIADPAGPRFEMTAHSFGQDKEALEGESIRTLKECKRVWKRLESHAEVKGKFDVRLIDEPFPAGVYFYDPQSEAGRMMLVPHVPGQDAAETPVFVFQSCPNGPLEHYFSMYQRVWRRATPYKAWAESNSSYLT